MHRLRLALHLLLLLDDGWQGLQHCYLCGGGSAALCCWPLSRPIPATDCDMALWTLAPAFMHLVTTSLVTCLAGPASRKLAVHVLLGGADTDAIVLPVHSWLRVRVAMTPFRKYALSATGVRAGQLKANTCLCRV